MRWRGLAWVAVLMSGSALAGTPEVALEPTQPTTAAQAAQTTPSPTIAAVPQQQLTLERVFASPGLAGAAPRGVALSPDGRLMTVLRPRADDRDRYDLWAVDTATGAERMLVDSTRLGGGELTEAERMQRERARVGSIKGILRYQWSPDGRSILVPVDGALYLAPVDGGSPRKLIVTPAGELNPTVSPRGSAVSFVRGQNLYALDLATGTERRLTPDGGGTVYWGEAEFVAQEEMSRMTGHWWSPDDRFLAVQRFDQAPVGTVTRTAIGAGSTRSYQQRYPAAGTPNVLTQLHIIPASGGQGVRVDLGADPDIYLARVDWAPDGRWLYVQRQTRDQKRLDMLRVDPATGASSVLFSETSPTWVNLSDNYRFLKDGSLIWWSERDGNGHLWRLRDGRWSQLTRGDYQVLGIAGIDETRGRMWLTTNRDSVLETQIDLLDLRRPGRLTRISERGFSTDAYADKSGQRLVMMRSSVTQPPQYYLADANGQRLSWIFENRLDATHPYAPFLAAHRTPTFGTMTAADGSTLHYSLLTPVMEPGRRYPVFFSHYGGPTSQQVRNSWTSALHQMLVQRGWIVFQIDNRGVENRGVAFNRQMYRAFGTVEVEDQLLGARWLANQPFVDPQRITTYGWSYGGYLTLKLLGAAPGVFAAGVSGAPVTRWGLYDTHYTERYLGMPQADAPTYARADAIDDAARIRDPLLLIHGMSDDNVILDNSTAFAAAMQANRRPFEMMFYPGQTHGFSGEAIQVHLWRTILSFLERHTAPGAATGQAATQP